ncbi:2-C-methyl-D-erythritol 2,4-cyclodiphosphate synthase, partial [Escherichia coli]|nr:2-C-methyl-D-erythritol 2,4-cyclodiphosphate synthase [Escherichia coli]
MTLGGVQIPHTHSLLAHSDGDVVLHALCDALLGALALGDIGQFFPDTDERFRNIDSTILLNQVYQFIQSKGFALINA